jgi:dolichyl-phosphate beta-glucosyltransferase
MLAEAVDYLHSTFPKHDYEILLIDDGSSDDTTGMALDWSKEYIAKGLLLPDQLRVVKLKQNRGKGGAVTHGMRHIRGKLALFADADGATKFEDFALLDAAVKQIGKDKAIAIGSRAHLVSTEQVVKRSPIRNALMYSFHFFLSLLGISHIRDTQCGFKLFTRSAVLSIFPYMHCEGWIFDIEIFILAEIMNIPVKECFVQWHEVEGTKLSLIRDSIKMAWDLVVLRAGYTFGVYGVEAKRNVGILPTPKGISKASLKK